MPRLRVCSYPVTRHVRVPSPGQALGAAPHTPRPEGEGSTMVQERNTVSELDPPLPSQGRGSGGKYGPLPPQASIGKW